MDEQRFGNKYALEALSLKSYFLNHFKLHFRNLFRIYFEVIFENPDNEILELSQI